MNTLNAEKRSMSIKAKRLRREGYVTGNLFGREINPSIPLKITTKEIHNLLLTENKGSHISLIVDGHTYDVIIKDIQWNGLKSRIDEIDFQALISTEKIHSVVQIIFEHRDNVAEGVFETVNTEVPYRAFPAYLVSEEKIDVSSLKVNEAIHVKDLAIASNKNIEILVDPNTVLGSVCPIRNTVTVESSEEESE